MCSRVVELKVETVCCTSGERELPCPVTLQIFDPQPHCNKWQIKQRFLGFLLILPAILQNEYTDWERPARSPIGSRDATMELLSDGHTAAPLIRMAYLHSVRGGRSYFLHFRHQTTERDFPQVSESRKRRRRIRVRKRDRRKDSVACDDKNPPPPLFLLTSL